MRGCHEGGCEKEGAMKGGSVKRGGCVKKGVPRRNPSFDQEAGGMHLTRMPSCLFSKLIKIWNRCPQ